MEQISWFETYTFWFIIPIVLLVLFLLLFVIFRFRESRNPVPSRTSHNTVIEVIWTAAPVLILLLIAIPSFNLLTAEYTPARRAGTDGQGDRPPVVLELRIPAGQRRGGRRGDRLRFDPSER